jgi:hypothetical protein
VQKGDSKMAQVLCELACCMFSYAAFMEWLSLQKGSMRTSRAFDSDDSRLDVNLDSLWDSQRLLGVYVLHLDRIAGGIAIIAGRSVNDFEDVSLARLWEGHFGPTICRWRFRCQASGINTASPHAFSVMPFVIYIVKTI